MKILLQGRGQATELQGGDSAVVFRLQRELQALGHEVEVHPRAPAEGLGGFDVVHGINLDRSVLAQTATLARAARAADVRFVLTPLWWPLDRYVAGLPTGDRLKFRLKGLPPLRALRDRRMSSLRGLRRRQAEVLAAAQMVCPSGQAEARALEKQFGPLPMRVVHFGTDARSTPTTSERTGVLCVGRIDPRKNQLALIKAMRGTGIRLHLIGTDRIFPAYATRCREIAGPDVLFHGYVETGVLKEEYGRARVHALPSYFELPGLTSLDAAAAGTAIVVTREGTAEDYFGEEANYSGMDEASIRVAVLEAYEAGPPLSLANRVATTLTWPATTTSYLETYG